MGDNMKTTLKTTILIARTMILVGLFFFVSDFVINIDQSWNLMDTIRLNNIMNYVMWAIIAEIGLKLAEMFTL